MGGGGVRYPQKVDFFNLTPLTFLQKPHFWPTLWLKVDLLADLGGLATGLYLGVLWILLKEKHKI